MVGVFLFRLFLIFFLLKRNVSFSRELLLLVFVVFQHPFRNNLFSFVFLIFIIFLFFCIFIFLSMFQKAVFSLTFILSD